MAGCPKIHTNKETLRGMIRARGASLSLRVSVPLWLSFLVLVLSMSGGFALPAYGVGGDVIGQVRDSKAGQQIPAATVVDSQGNVIIAGSENLTGVTQFYTVKVNTSTPGSPVVAWTATLNRCSNNSSIICSVDSDCGSGNSCNVAPPGNDQISAVAVDSANNVIVAGYIYNGSNFQCQIVKYSGANGLVLWKQTYATPSNGYCAAIAVDGSDNIYVGGYSGAGGQQDFLVLKYDSAGNLQGGWPATYDALRCSNNHTKVCTADTDCGSGNSCNYQGKTDILTSLVWTGDGTGVAAAGYSQRNICHLDNSANCMVDADCGSNGPCDTNNFDYLTVKFGPNGSSPLWVKRYPEAGTGKGGDNGQRLIKADTAGNVIVTDSVTNAAGDNDIYTIKYNGASGATMGAWTYNSGFADVPKAILVDGAGDIYIAGYASNPDGSNKFYVARYNGSSSSGQKVWESVGFGAGNNDPATAVSMAMDLSGDLFVAGYVYKASSAGFDWLTAKYSGSSGNLLWQKTFDGAQHNDEAVVVAFSKTCTNSPATPCATDSVCSPGTCGNLYVAGWSDAWTSGAADDDYYLINYDRGLLNPPTSLTATAGVCSDNTTVCTKDSDCGANTPCAATKIKLTWQDNSTNEADFVIERKQGEFDPNGYQQVQTINSPAPPNGMGAVSYTDTGLTANNYYYYRLRAHNSTLYSNYSNEAHALTTMVSLSSPTGTYLYDNQAAYVCTDRTTPCSRDTDCPHEDTYSNVCEISVPNDAATGIVTGPDDNPVITGYSASSSVDYDYYTFKLDRSNMTVKWSDRYGNSNREDEAACIAVDKNGNAVVSGFSEVSVPGGSGYDYAHQIYTIKYSGAYPTSGELKLWEAQYNNPFQKNVDAITVATALDSYNNIVVAGYGKNTSGNDDIYIIKYLSGGVCSNNTGTSCTSDQDCVFPGFCTASADWVVRYDGPSHGDDRPAAVSFDADGNIFVTGYIYNGATNQDDWFTAKYCGSSACSNKLDKACGRDSDCSQALNEGTCGGIYSKCNGQTKGQVIWSDTFNGSGSGNDHAASLAMDSYGNVFVTGYSVNSSGNEDWLTTKYCGSNMLSSCPNGNRIVWQKTYDGPAHGDDEAKTVRVDPIDGAVVVAGRSLASSGTCSGSPSACSNYPTRSCSVNSDCDNHDFHIIRYAATDGSVVWERNFERQNNNDDLVAAMEMDSSGYIYVAGDTKNGSNLDILSVIYDYEGTFLGAMTYNRAWCSVTTAASCLTDSNCPSNEHCISGDDSASAMAINYRGEAFIAGYSMNPNNNQDIVVLKQDNKYLMSPAPFSAVAVTDPGNVYKANLSWHNNTKLCSGDTTMICSADSDCSSSGKGTCTATTGVRIERIAATLPGLPSCPSPSDGGWTLINTINPGTSVPTSWTDAGPLLEDANYCYRIESFTGTLPSRKPVAAVTTTLRSPILNSPSGITTGSMNFSWNSIAGPGPTPCPTSGLTGQNCTQATSYTLGYNTNGSTTAYTNITTPTNCTGIGTTSCAPSGLPSGTLYYFAVKATDANGDSVWSNQVTAYTLPAKPALNNPSNVQTDRVDLTWGSVAGASSYSAQCKASGGSYGPCSGCVGVTGTSCTVTGLTPGTLYYFQLKATDGSGDSDWSNEASTFTIPTAPTLSSVTRSATCSDNNATISWDWNGPGAQTGYYIEYSYCNDANPSNCSGGYSFNYWQALAYPTQKTYAYSMNPGWAYKFRVYSTVNNGGAKSAPSSVGYVWACLGTLTQNTIIPLSNTSLKPNWTDITGATNYDVQRKDCTGPCNGGTCSGGTYNTIPPALGYNVNSYPDAGLAQNTSYSYIIRAYNSAVAGTNPTINDAFTSGINSTTWWQAGYLGSTSATSPPINLSDGNGSASVTWAAGAVEFDTASNGNDTSGTNQAQIGLNNIAPFAGDFDSQISYSLPSGQLIPDPSWGMNYYVDFRVDFSSDGNTRVAVQRHVEGTGNGYTAGVFVNGTALNINYLTSDDTSGILRITRTGSTVYAYVWTGAAWQLLAQASDASLVGTPARVYVFQNALRNNAISLKAQVDNFIATFPQNAVNGLNPPTDVYSNAQCLATPPPSPDPLTLTNVTTSQIQLNWQNNGGGKYTGYEIQRSQASYTNNPEYDSNTSNWGSWTTIAGNLAADPDFENSTTSWTGTVGTLTGVSFDTSVYFSGGKSLKLTATGATLGRYQTVSVTVGAQYVLSGNLRTSLTGATGRAQCDVQGSGIDSPGIGINAQGDPNNDSNWHYLTETVTIPSGTSSVNIRCFADGAPNGAAYFDLITFFPLALATPSTTTYIDAGLTAGYGYKYQVRALFNGPGLYTAFTSPAFTRTYPSAPTWHADAQNGLSPVSDSQVNAYWNDVTGDVGYQLFYMPRSNCSNNVYKPCTVATQTVDCGSGNTCNERASCPAPGVGVNGWPSLPSYAAGENYTAWAATYPVTGLSADTYYCFAVRACRAYNCSDANGYSAFSPAGQRQTPPIKPVLNDPYNFVTNPATCVTLPNNSSSMDLSWTYSGSGAPTGYQIQRKTGTGGTYAAIATPSASPYTNPGLKSGEYYCYQVYAKNDEGYYSVGSNEKCARTTPCQPQVTLSADSPSQITLSWPVIYGATNYKIYRRQDPGSYPGSPNYNDPVAYQELYCNQLYPYVGCTVLSPITTTYSDTGLSENANYCYEVTAYNTDSNRDSGFNEVCLMTSDLAKPTLSGNALSCQEIQLTWTYDPNSCSPNSCRSDIDGVSIEAKLREGIWTQFATTSAATHSFIDKIARNPNSGYRYRARAFKCEDSGNNPCTCGSGGSCAYKYSAYSDELYVTTPSYAPGCNTCD